ncbi:MAG: hypothetical protein H0T42_05320 [Deltaproteobacteria bacterium]|nr:hypothetical protein [Deltaproteobacteria bacterium]
MVRRQLALYADADRLPLGPGFIEVASHGPLPIADATQMLATYLLDPRAGAMLATSEDLATWFESPLFAWVGPGNAAPLDDLIAALIAAPVLGRGAALASVLTAGRFSPRADDLVALAICSLDLPAQATALEALFADAGPDHELLGLSVVQCGRVLAWAPHLLEWPVAETIVKALLARLGPATPKPLLDGISRALGPIAMRPGPLAETIRTAALAGLEALTQMTNPGKSGSFLDQVTTIGKTRTLPDQDRWMSQPRREVAHACAYILGVASPLERTAFSSYRDRVLDRPEADGLFLPFVEGLIAGAHIPAVGELVQGMLAASDAEAAAGLGLAAALPLDSISHLIIAHLDAPQISLRTLAVAAAEILASTEDLDVDASIAMRLGDPSPEVCAAATRSLLARGRRDLLGKHSARDPHPVRRAVVLAGLGEVSVAVIGELVTGSLARLDDVNTETEPTSEDEDVTPVTKLLADSLLCSVKGIEVACDLIGGVPDSVGLLALACLPGTQRDIGILAPPGPRTALARVTIDIAQADDAELGALALYLLARMSAGDETIAEVVSDALAATDGWAQNLLAALGELRVASERTGAALAPFLGPDSPIGARVAATAVSGRVLPADHAAWAHVRELLELGTIARAAAWSALRDRARRMSAIGT